MDEVLRSMEWVNQRLEQVFAKRKTLASVIGAHKSTLLYHDYSSGKQGQLSGCTPPAFEGDSIAVHGDAGVSKRQDILPRGANRIRRIDSAITILRMLLGLNCRGGFPLDIQ